MEWFQALDYLSVIAVIKSAESVWGGLLTVSGAFTAYRTAALRSVGGWDNSSPTEDIDVSWRLQTAGWRLALNQPGSRGLKWHRRCSAVAPAPPLECGPWPRAARSWLRAITNGVWHLPIVVLTFLGLTWLVSMLAFLAICFRSCSGLRGLRLGGTPTDTGNSHSGWSCCLLWATRDRLCGRRQKSTHTLAQCSPWRLFTRLYFWGILLTSFLAGFPKGVLRLDGGNWQRTLRRIDIRSAQ